MTCVVCTWVEQRSVLFLLLNNQNVRNFHCMLRNARHVLWAVSKLVEAVNNICVVGGEIDHIFKDVEVAWHSFILWEMHN